MTPSILIVHPDRKTQRIVQRILGVTGHQIDIADSLDQARELLHHHVPLLVIVDGAAATVPHPFFAEAIARGAESCMALLAGTPTDAVPHIVGTGAVTNLLVHPMPVLAEELLTTTLKLIRGDLFGAEKYLLWGTELHETVLTRASQRTILVEKLSEAVRARGQRGRVASMAALIADELISNAVHNAPVDAAGVHYRKEVSRGTELELDDRHRVRLRWGCDARYLAIEVTDFFGSLDRDTILRSLVSNDVRESGSGAGMGVALSYRSSDHLVFNLAPSKRTEIVALIDVRYPPVDRVAASSYNVFVERDRP